MKLLNRVVAIVALTAAFVPLTSMACDAAGAQTHVGNILSVDAGKNTFTIRDAETSSPITFVTVDPKIINSLKDAKGSIMVNYEEQDDSTDLMAVGVTF
ncbi:MAG: hypothetical protein ACC707_05200 [Thiohalomonadales bacterium]